MFEGGEEREREGMKEEDGRRERLEGEGEEGVRKGEEER